MKQLCVMAIFALALVFSACEEKKTPAEPKLSGQIEFGFEFSSGSYVVGEDICLEIKVKNGSPEELAMKDFPAKMLELFGPDNTPVKRFQRTEFPRPPRMFLKPGEESISEVDLSGTFENLGPGLLSAGEYTLRATMSYYQGEDIKVRQRLLKVSSETKFTVEEPSGADAKALEEFVSIVGGEKALAEMVGVSKVELSPQTRAELDEFAAKYPTAPLGSRILVNHLGVWYSKVPIERFSQYFQKAKGDCPCCLQRHVIDRMVKRYVISSERDQILDLVEEGLERYPEKTEVGAYLRKVFGFRIEEGKVIR